MAGLLTMTISAKAEYACLAVIELAKAGTSAVSRHVKDIAEAQGIPHRSLVQILLQLKAAGFVQSFRGSDGGYRLIRQPDEISVADIISCIDGPSDPPRMGASPAALELVGLVRRAQSAERDVFAAATISQLL